MDKQIIDLHILDIRDEIFRAEHEFGNLSKEQLNWKPSPRNWSIAQCLEHLLITDCGYFPQLQNVIEGKPIRNIWFKVPVLPVAIGNMIVRSVSPQATRRFPSPPAFKPATKEIDPSVREDFKLHLEQLIDHYEKLKAVDTENVKIHSPAAGFVIFALPDALLLIVNHLKRHILQGINIKKKPGFPVS